MNKRWLLAPAILCGAIGVSATVRAQMRPPVGPPPQGWRSQDPRVGHSDRPPFCQGFRPRSAPARELGDRVARFELDAECATAPRARCVGGGIARRVEHPTSCLAVGLYEGTGSGERRMMGEERHRLMCAQCPSQTQSDGSFLECDTAQKLREAQAMGDVFNLPQREVAEMQRLYAEARAVPGRWWDSNDRAERILEIVRIAARAVNYCSDTQLFLPNRGAATRAANGAIVSRAPLFPRQRIDLHRFLLFGADTGDQTGFAINPMGETLTVYPNGLAGRTATTMSVDAVLLQLLHEMRHMATPNYASGEDRYSDPERDAQRRLNELTDYSEMLRHPFYFAIANDEARWLEAQFLDGRRQEMECFATVWHTGDGRGGYPRDTAPSTAAATRGGAPMGFGGLPMLTLMGQGAQRAQAPLEEPRSVPARCLSTVSGGRRSATALTDAQRCNVAAWAKSDVFMRGLMVRTIALGNEQQPWNTLAHWSLLLPFRARPACTPTIAP
jgi:hypothetical protein